MPFAADPTGLHVGLFQTEFDGFYHDHVLTARHMSARHIATGFGFLDGPSRAMLREGGT